MNNLFGFEDFQENKEKKKINNIDKIRQKNKKLIKEVFNAKELYTKETYEKRVN